MTVDRWKCTSYCPCRPESRGHFEKSDEGVWVLRADHEAIIARHASAALAGMNAAKAISSNDVQRAARLRAESSPDALESERQANAKLTQELSLAEEGLANYAQENERLRKELAQSKRLLNPRLWTQAESSAWHRTIPDLYGAFEALRASQPQPREQT